MTFVDSVIALGEMSTEHLDSVVAIEQRVFPEPWSLNLFTDELQIENTRVYTVALADDRVVGYTGLMFIEDVVHIMTMAVDPDFQQRGIATQLMQHNLDVCQARGINAVTLEVRVSNEPAIKLYRRYGFAPAGIRRRYYSNPPEDALIFWRHEADVR